MAHRLYIPGKNRWRASLLSDACDVGSCFNRLGRLREIHVRLAKRHPREIRSPSKHEPGLSTTLLIYLHDFISDGNRNIFSVSEEIHALLIDGDVFNRSRSPDQDRWSAAVFAYLHNYCPGFAYPVHV